ncbi:hypothetical protein T03_3795 [Trichinella britovi]|uniref:Uncharacterized protein n=1 Tax=Trichinella britovi TaxID=45882 RepID=A0A0V1C6K0_TRIBR|nr:hypothetical protein T03_17539 [Trichinella britovi]KRY44939.1 hypothetical protein T03_3795 [Trichinella britovi]
MISRIRVSRYITFVGKGDFNAKRKCTSDKLSTAAVADCSLKIYPDRV